MRREFARIMQELIEKDSKVVLIILDIGGNLFSEIEKKYPNRFYNFGVTEQAAIGVASGMALQGMKPYLFTITPFLSERPFEQVKLDLVGQKANVKLVGFWDYPDAGDTHRAIDIAKECELLGIRLIQPANSNQLRKKMLEYNEINEPVFFSLIKDDSK